MTAGAWIWLIATAIGTPLSVVLFIYYDAVWSEGRKVKQPPSTLTLRHGDQSCWCDDG